MGRHPRSTGRYYDSAIVRSLVPHTSKPLLRLAAMGLILAALPGCQSIQSTVNNSAQIRFIHASPNTSGLDIYQNTSAVAYNLGFGTITSYVPVLPATYSFSANAASTRNTQVSTRQTLSAAKQYTAIIGNVAAGLQETILADQTSPAPAGLVSIRFIDQAVYVSALDMYLVPATTRLLASIPIATNVVLAGNTGYINIPAGTYALAVVPAGTLLTSTTIPLLTGPQVTYASGSVRTIVLIDAPMSETPAVAAIVASDYDAPVPAS